jgi:hypothetical protein
LIALIVWPVVRFSHTLFREDHRAMIWASALLVFVTWDTGSPLRSW